MPIEMTSVILSHVCVHFQGKSFTQQYQLSFLTMDLAIIAFAYSSSLMEKKKKKDIQVPSNLRRQRTISFLFSSASQPLGGKGRQEKRKDTAEMTITLSINYTSTKL